MSGTNELSRFIRDLAASLNAGRILYLGCTHADDLSEFPAGADVSGVAADAATLARMIERYPTFGFGQSDPSETAYDENRFDFTFARGLFGGLDEKTAEKTLGEMYRISSKYIANFEAFPEERDPSPDGSGGKASHCDMYSKWSRFQVRVISNVQMHGDIDPGRSRFTLVRKIR